MIHTKKSNRHVTRFTCVWPQGITEMIPNSTKHNKRGQVSNGNGWYTQKEFWQNWCVNVFASLTDDHYCLQKIMSSGCFGSCDTAVVVSFEVLFNFLFFLFISFSESKSWRLVFQFSVLYLQQINFWWSDRNFVANFIVRIWYCNEKMLILKT
mgnify:CR=1 FL=1